MIFFKTCSDCSCLSNLDEVRYYRNYKFVKGNICSADLVNYVLQEEEIDTIVHFAAQTHVGKSNEHPESVGLSKVVVLCVVTEQHISLLYSYHMHPSWRYRWNLIFVNFMLCSFQTTRSETLSSSLRITSSEPTCSWSQLRYKTH